MSAPELKQDEPQQVNTKTEEHQKTEEQPKNESGKQDEQQIQIPETLPVLPLREVVTFPYMIVPILVSVDKAIAAVDQALAQSRMILLVTQRDQEVENPSSKDLFDLGTVGMVIRMLKMPDQKVRV